MITTSRLQEHLPSQFLCHQNALIPPYETCHQSSKCTLNSNSGISFDQIRTQLSNQMCLTELSWSLRWKWELIQLKVKVRADSAESENDFPHLSCVGCLSGGTWSGNRRLLWIDHFSTRWPSLNPISVNLLEKWILWVFHKNLDVALFSFSLLRREGRGLVEDQIIVSRGLQLEVGSQRTHRLLISYFEWLSVNLDFSFDQMDSDLKCSVWSLSFVNV